MTVLGVGFLVLFAFAAATSLASGKGPGFGVGGLAAVAVIAAGMFRRAHVIVDPSRGVIE
jgi:hypothetical protein